MRKGPVLETRGLEKYFTQQTSIVDTILRRDKDEIQAVDGVDLRIEANDSIAIIGESGCGKTTLLFTLMGLYDHTGGMMRFRGQDTAGFAQADWKKFRRNVQVIFQDPFNSLDPKLSVEQTLKEPLKIHNIDDQDRRVDEILRQVELDPPEKYRTSLPRNLSGGEKQRVSIARALILEPDVILADEPVSMLDVSTQAAILNMLRRLTDEMGVALIYISHDLSTVSYVAEEVNVMYLGRIVESAPTEQLIEDPLHPYTQALIAAVPIPDPSYDRPRTQMDGSPRDPINLGEGCRFRDRCPERMDICETAPEYHPHEGGEQSVACHLYYDHQERSERETLQDPPQQSET